MFHDMVVFWYFVPRVQSRIPCTLSTLSSYTWIHHIRNTILIPHEKMCLVIECFLFSNCTLLHPCLLPQWSPGHNTCWFYFVGTALYFLYLSYDFLYKNKPLKKSSLLPWTSSFFKKIFCIWMYNIGGRSWRVGMFASEVHAANSLHSPWHRFWGSTQFDKHAQLLNVLSSQYKRFFFLL